MDTDSYDEMLDSTHPEVVIMGVTFTASQILKKCDPVAYRSGLSALEED